jgi:hypothetical protein
LHIGMCGQTLELRGKNEISPPHNTFPSEPLTLEAFLARGTNIWSCFQSLPNRVVTFRRQCIKLY